MWKRTKINKKGRVWRIFKNPADAAIHLLDHGGKGRVGIAWDMQSRWVAHYHKHNSLLLGPYEALISFYWKTLIFQVSWIFIL